MKKNNERISSTANAAALQSMDLAVRVQLSQSRLGQRIERVRVSALKTVAHPNTVRAEFAAALLANNLNTVVEHRFAETARSFTFAVEGVASAMDVHQLGASVLAHLMATGAACTVEECTVRGSLAPVTCDSFWAAARSVAGSVRAVRTPAPVRAPHTPTAAEYAAVNVGFDTVGRIDGGVRNNLRTPVATADDVFAGLRAAITNGDARAYNPDAFTPAASDKRGRIARVGVRADGVPCIAFVPSEAAAVLNAVAGAHAWDAERFANVLRAVAAPGANESQMRLVLDHSTGVRVPMLSVPVTVWDESSPLARSGAQLVTAADGLR